MEAEVLERLAGRDPELGLHEVDVGDLFGDGVLDLDPRVHLDEDVPTFGAHEELDSAGVDVADLAGERDGIGADPVTEVRVQVGGRGDLDDLLVPALQRAVALEEVHDVALPVGEDLHLDVARVGDGLLDEDGRVAERAVGLSHRCLDGVSKLVRIIHAAHAAAAAARDGLDEDGEVERRGVPAHLVDVARRGDVGEHRHARCPGSRHRTRLVAGQPEDVRARADERDPGGHARLRQCRVLRQEAVAGVDRLGTGMHGGLDDGLRVEVGTDGVAPLADLVGLVGLQPVLGPAVLVRKHGHGLGAELVRRPERPDRDLAPVGHQHLREHGPTLESVRIVASRSRRTRGAHWCATGLSSRCTPRRCPGENPLSPGPV